MSLEIQRRDENLIEALEIAIKNIKEGVYDDLDKECMYCFIKQYTTGQLIKPDPEILKYLFTGWFIHENSNNKTEYSDQIDE